jgi:hypothetical protein
LVVPASPSQSAGAVTPRRNRRPVTEAGVMRTKSCFGVGLADDVIENFRRLFRWRFVRTIGVGFGLREHLFDPRRVGRM